MFNEETVQFLRLMPQHADANLDASASQATNPFARNKRVWVFHAYNHTSNSTLQNEVNAGWRLAVMGAWF
jgi:hypothetical protein